MEKEWKSSTRQKNKVLIIFGIVLSLIIILGSSYAYLRVKRNGSNQDISIANFGLVIKEDMKEITLDKEVPKSDEEGLKNSPNTFVIENQGDVTAKYRLSLVDGTVASTMSNLDIKYRVKRTRSSGEEIGEVKTLGADGLFDEGIIAPNEEISFELIIWINHDANPNGLTYSKVLSLEGLQADTLDTSEANPPEMLPNMIPVYYDKISDTEGVWRKADITNQDESHKWYDYNDFMWANAVTVKDEETIMSDSTYNSVLEPLYTYTKLDNENVYFDGVDDFYDLGHANVDLGSNISVVVRFKVTSFTGDNGVIIGNLENGGIAFKVLSNQKVYFALHTGGNYHSISSAKTIDVGKWYTAVATYDNTNMQLYVYQDGNLLSNDTLKLTGSITESPAPFMLGADPGSSGLPASQYLNAEIEKVLVYTDTLTASEITNNFKGTITTYPSDNLLIETKEFAEPIDWHSKFTKNEDGSLSFDGANDFYYLGQENYDFKNAISLVARFKVNSVPSNGYIIGNAEAAGFYFVVSNSKKVHFALHIGESYRIIISSNTIDEGKWYTAVATYDNTNMQLYIYQDGDLISRDKLSISGAIKVSQAPLMLGANPIPNGFSNSEFLNFTISSMYVYTDTLTDSEIETFFKNNTGNYPKDHLLIAYDNFNGKSKRDVYENAKPGIEVKMDDISSMWVWIPRYKYTIFNGNNETSKEQMINVEFERGINSTGTVSCHDDILTANDSNHSEICEDTVNNGIKNGISTYTHPAFTFGSEELVGFWFAKFSMSTDDRTCLESQSETNCNKEGMNLLVKPNQISLRYQRFDTMFGNIRNMEKYKNIHGFNQSENAVTISSNGEIVNDSNNYDIHMVKNMEWGAVAYLTMSKYGKYGNSLYKDAYKEIYVNNYETNDGNIKTNMTGYSGKNPNAAAGTTGVQYNNLTIETEGQGYIGAGASTTGTVYGIYDMSGGGYDYVAGIMADKNGKFQGPTSYSMKYDLDNKYYDKYSYSTNISTAIYYQEKEKLGDATKEVLTSSLYWYKDQYQITYSSNHFLCRGAYSDGGSLAGIFATGAVPGNSGNGVTSRPVLTISRDFLWKDN